MKIINSTNNLTPTELYALTKGQTKPLNKSFDAGDIVAVKAWAIFEKEDRLNEENPETIQVVSFIDADTNIAYGTISDTFVREFSDLVDFRAELGLPTDSFNIQIEKGISKKSREFIYCSFAE